MTSGGGSAREAMRAMRERYRAGSGAIVERFLALAADMAREPDSPELVEAVRREAHRVHGTAGTYGFAEASDIAASLERRCRTWAEDRAAEKDDRAAIIERAARAIEAAFALPARPDGGARGD